MNDFTYDDDGNPVRLSRSRKGSPDSNDSQTSEKLTAIFQVDGHSYDVVLEHGKITLSSLTGSSKVPKAMRSSKSGSFKKRSSSRTSLNGSISDSANRSILELKDIFGAKIKRLRSTGQREGEGVCQGLALYVYEKKDDVRLKDRLMLLEHPSEQLCTAWCNRIQIGFKELTERPRRIQVFLQPFAGKKSAKHVYTSKVEPLFQAASLEVDYIEILHNEHIKQEMIHIDLKKYDCIVSVGGDGTASKTINGLLNKVQKRHDVDIKPGFNPHKPKVTVGIIPAGTINQLSNTANSTDDPVTAALHIILGNTQSMDVCTVFSEDKLLHWAFNCHYGMFGNVLKYFHRYSTLGHKKVDAAFVKALTQKKFNCSSYQCDIQYLVSPESFSSHPMDGRICHKGCSICNLDLDASSNSTFSDMVEELSPLNNSSDGSEIMDLSKENPMKTIKGEYHNISLFSNPALSDLAPRGASKFTHIADGCIDLVLIKKTDRKEFIRYLKRHGNYKNQFDFPFIETYRCTEVKVRFRSRGTWKHKDHKFSEIDYEMQKTEKKVKKTLVQKSQEEVVIDDLESDSDLDIESDLGRKVQRLTTKSSRENVSDKKPPKAPVPQKSLSEPKRRAVELRRARMSRGSLFESTTSSGKQSLNSSVEDVCQDDNIENTSPKLDARPPSGMSHSETSKSTSRWKKKKDKKKEKTLKRQKSTLSLNSEISVADSVTSLHSGIGDFDSDEDNCEVVEMLDESNKKSILKELFKVTPANPDAPPVYRPTLAEVENERRRKDKIKKEEKAKEKEEMRSKSSWNVDNELFPMEEYSFKVHNGLLKIHGQGRTPGVHPDDVKHSCLKMF